MTGRAVRFLLRWAALLLGIAVLLALVTVGSAALLGTEGNFLAGYLVAFPLIAEVLFLVSGSSMAMFLMRLMVAMSCPRRAAWAGMQIVTWLCWAALLAISLGMFRMARVFGMEMLFSTDAVFHGLFLALAGQLALPVGLLQGRRAWDLVIAAGIPGIALTGIILSWLWQQSMLPIPVYQGIQVVCAGAVAALFVAGRRLAMRLAPQQM